jgi:putative phosphoesterase
MIIGIFSDVHDNIPNLNRARDVFIDHKVEMCFFCGDLVSPFTLKYFDSWPMPIKAVLGNNEGDKWGITRRLKKYNLPIKYPEKGYIFEHHISEKNIFQFHGHLSQATDLAIQSGKYDLVLTGHTHQPHIKTINNTTWINPGSVTGISENPDIKTGSVAIYDLTSCQGEIIKLHN